MGAPDAISCASRARVCSAAVIALGSLWPLAACALPEVSLQQQWESDSTTTVKPVRGSDQPSRDPRSDAAASVSDAPSSGDAAAAASTTSGGRAGIDSGRPFALGQACSMGSECESGSCQDRTCCAANRCGVCESCASGKCEPIRGAIDPDSCTNTMICNDEHVCVQQDGQPCSQNSECSSLNCLASRCEPAGVHCDDRACAMCSVCSSPSDLSCSPIVGPDTSGRCAGSQTCSTQNTCLAITEQCTNSSARRGEETLTTRNFAQIITFKESARLTELSIIAACGGGTTGAASAATAPAVWIEGVGSDGKPNGTHLSETTVRSAMSASTPYYDAVRLTTTTSVSPNSRIALVIGRSAGCFVTTYPDTTCAAGSMFARDNDGPWMLQSSGALWFQALVTP